MTLYKVEVGSALYKEGIRWTERGQTDVTDMVGLGDINLDSINLCWMTWPKCTVGCTTKTCFSGIKLNVQ